MSDHPLPVGTRVYHWRAQRYDEAVRGTATVLAVEPRHAGGYEYLVQRDKPILPSMPNEPVYWANYHIAKAVTFDE